jgi:hypothetical protein
MFRYVERIKTDISKRKECKNKFRFHFQNRLMKQLLGKRQSLVEKDLSIVAAGLVNNHN